MNASRKFILLQYSTKLVWGICSTDGLDIWLWALYQVLVMKNYILLTLAWVSKLSVLENIVACHCCCIGVADQCQAFLAINHWRTRRTIIVGVVVTSYHFFLFISGWGNPAHFSRARMAKYVYMTYQINISILSKLWCIFTYFIFTYILEGMVDESHQWQL